MKLNNLYLVLGLGAVLSLGSCSDDNGSNPTLVQPTSFVLNTPEFAENVVDLQTMTVDDGITFTWNQPTVTDNGAPIGNYQGSGICYQVMLSPTGTFTKAFVADSVNTKTGTYKGNADFDYVVMDNVYSTTQTTVLGKDLDYNLNRWNSFSSQATTKWTEGADCASMNVTVKVVAKVAAGPGIYVESIESNPVTIKVKPYYTMPYTKDLPQPIYMPGNGNGWNHSVCPMLSWSEDEDAFVGYAYMDGEFKFTPDANWDSEYNCSNFDASLCSENIVINDGSGNIGFSGEAGMYYLKVNTTKKYITAEARPWYLVGNYNGWTAVDPTQKMTYDTSEHCLVFKNAQITADGWKFVVDSQWAVNLGGDLSNLIQDGGNLTATGSTVKLYLEKNSTNKDSFKYHATVE